MRALFSSSSSPSLFSLPARNPLLFLLLLRRIPSPSTPPPPPPLPPLPTPLLARSLHALAPPPSAPPPSRILQSDPNPGPASEVDNGDDGDDPMDEFLSRFVWAIRGKLADAFPGLPRETLDGMLLVICQKVVARLDGGSPASADGDSPLDLSEDLWRTIWEVSNSVHEAMRRDRVRAELKQYLHCDEVKEMCRFAADVGIRGPFLRELRFKWARGKLDEVEFYRGLDRMREQGQKREQEGGEEKGAPPMVTALPQRKGKIKYKIYGLDLSDPKWAEVAEKVAEAEKHFVPEEPQPIEGKCKKVEEKILALNAKRDDPAPLLAEWAEHLGPKRVDWLALLDRIKERNLNLYFKIAELLLDEESFETAIRDYSKLIDLHSKADRLEDAERILQKMTEKGIDPDILTSITLVHMYSKAGNLDRAKEAFERLRKEGFQPDLKLYNSMIMAYVKSGLPKQGEMLMREMEVKDIKPTKELYMELLRAFAARGQVDGAQRIMNTMQFSGIQPTLESFTLLIEAYGQAGDPDQARGHFDQMVKSGHKPDDRCTASMITAYAKKNLLDKALDLLLTLEKDRFKPGVLTNTVLADWLGRLQLVEEAEQLVKQIKETGEEAPFEIHIGLCDMYARAKQEEKLRKSMKILEGRKQMLKADQFERVISGLLAGGFVQDAKRMHGLMQARGFAPSESVRVALMAAQSIPRPRPASRKRG
uniref:Pentacotripeptide-repeat region of PRORP domain-containing protein n=1 Tax=Ananas comosus var. bracteatus TaxID=296719 RepID=A0A6V7P4M9_ANACO|nr:unnamed protein product [Ananas comosus var. bracteatus]